MIILQIILAIVNGVVAFLLIKLGITTIHRREGPMTTRSRSRYIATGSYAVWVGSGQLIAGIGFLIFALAFLWNLLIGLIAFPIVLLLLIIGRLIQNQGYNDPNIEVLVQDDKRYNESRDNDPDVLRTRWEKVKKFVLFAVTGGAVMTYLLFIDAWSGIIQKPFEERLGYVWMVFITWGVFSGLFFLPSLKYIRRQRERGTW